MFRDRPIGPDAHRYLIAGAGEPVTRPFHLRWLLPALLGDSLRRWWIVWFGSWVVLAVATGFWAYGSGLTGWRLLAAIVFLVALPGILGPEVSIPVQVDLPATALTIAGVALIATGETTNIIIGVVILTIGAMIRETVPVVAALLAWNPIALVALLAPVVCQIVRTPATRSGVDEWDAITAHPIRAGIAYHAGRWRDARLMVLPWGVCIAGLYAPTPRIVVIVLVAYLQLLVATDTVRIVQHVAAPALSLAAAAIIPVEWLPLAIIAHTFWFIIPERI